MLFAAGICYCVVDKPLGLPQINLFVMALICSIILLGLHFIFPKKGKEVFGSDEDEEYLIEGGDGESVPGSRDSAERISSDTVFSSVTRYVDSQDFAEYKGDIAFSTVNLFLDKARLKDGQATIKGDVVFSTLNLYVPREWNVEFKGESVFSGGITSKGQKAPYNADAPTVTLLGDRVFSKVTVNYL